LSYSPENQQYRCTIVRGKGQTDIEDFLPVYANIINAVCPCNPETFAKQFESQLSQALPMATAKTLSNHRTEIAGKLFGMYFEKDSIVQMSEPTSKLLKDSDLPSFFKDICFKLQFPNGMDSTANLVERFEKRICLRPCVFIIQCMDYALTKQNALTRNELGFYALNCLSVLQGKVSPSQVVNRILKDRKSDSVHTLESGSYDRQHIVEIFNYLELANLIKVENDVVTLNLAETRSLEIFKSSDYSKILFDTYKYDLNDREEREGFYVEWDEYYSKLAHSKWDVFETTTRALNSKINFDGRAGVDATQIGDDGEKLIYQFERARINAVNPRWSDKVKIVGGTRGLGYDVHSIHGDGPAPSRAVHIEVKSTKRKTIPAHIEDSVTLTRNEWQAAEQYGADYWIYRVYLTAEGAFVFPIKDVKGKADEGIISVEAMEYRVDFSGTKDSLFLIGQEG